MFITVKAHATNPLELSELLAILNEAEINVMTQPLVRTERTQAYADGFYDFISNILVFQVPVTQKLSDKIHGLSKMYSGISVSAT